MDGIAQGRQIPSLLKDPYGLSWVLVELLCVILMGYTYLVRNLSLSHIQK